MTTIILTNIYLFKANNKGTKTTEKEQQSNLIDVVLVSLLLTLIIILTFSSVF